MLLDPLEEQLDLPAALVEGGNRQRWQRCVVGQKDQRFARLGILEPDASQVLGVLLGRVVPVEHDPPVADDAAAAVGGCRVDASIGDFPDMDKAAQAKIFTAEMAFRVSSDALQMFGSAGYGRDLPMVRHVRDARLFTIAGETAQILRTQIASAILGMKLPQTRTGYAQAAERKAGT